MTFDPDTAATVAEAMGAVIVHNLYAGADADRSRELAALFAVYLQDAIFAYVEAVNLWREFPSPSVN